MFEMHVGDRMLFETKTGAYPVAAASAFSGFQAPTIYRVMSGPAWQVMQQIQNRDFAPEVEEQAVGTCPCRARQPALPLVPVCR